MALEGQGEGLVSARQLAHRRSAFSAAGRDRYEELDTSSIPALLCVATKYLAVLDKHSHELG